MSNQFPRNPNIPPSIMNTQPTDQQNHLIAKTTQLFHQAASSSGLMSLIASREDKECRRHLQNNILQQESRHLELRIQEARETISVGIAIAEQAHIDRMRVDYQNTFGAMAQQAEIDARHGAINLYAAKAGILQSVAKLDADADLKEFAAQTISRLTEVNAAKVFEHNQIKPR